MSVSILSNKKFLNVHELELAFDCINWVIQLFLKIVLPPALGPDITMILFSCCNSIVWMCNFLFLFVIQIQKGGRHL
jgi:hypothetical protein